VWHNLEEKCLDEPYTEWNMTLLSVQACSFDSYKDKNLTKTDSRLRPDRIALENLDYNLAASEKHRLEEAQRHKKKVRDEKSLLWIPKYFVEDENNINHRWTYKNNYQWSK
jgi:hypothetical protein